MVHGSERGRLHSDPGGERVEHRAHLQLDPGPRAPLASNLVMYVSAADNDYVGVTGTFLGTASQGVWPGLLGAAGGIAKLHFGAFGGLQPAQFFVKKKSSEKSEVLVTMSVLEAKSCGAETVPELVTSPQTLPIDTPPLVAVKVQSRLSQSSKPAEGRPGDGQRGARERP